MSTENTTLPTTEASSCCSTAPAQEAAPAPAASSCCSTAPAQEAAPAPAASSCCGGGSAKAEKEAASQTVVCPVMGGTVVDTAVAEAQGLFRDYEGERYWFCCAGCGPAFDADPARYAAA